MAAENGNTVKVHYTGRLKDGTIFDSSREREPLEFTIGKAQVIPGFENAVIGMNVGENKTVDIPVADAYGERMDDLVLEVGRVDLPEGLDPQIGEQLVMQNEMGQQIGVTVVDQNEEAVLLDANHPLAGQDLIFDLELVEFN